MNPTRKISLITSALLASAAAPAFAGNASITIEDYIGKVTINTSPNAELSIDIDTGKFDVDVDQDRNDLVINGGFDDPDGDDCKGYRGKLSWSWGKNDTDESLSLIHI